MFCSKMTGKDDPTISCTHLMVKLSVLAGRKIILKGELPRFGRRWLKKKKIDPKIFGKKCAQTGNTALNLPNIPFFVPFINT